eukprot:SAG22_NODE_259_length_13477_cov_10.020407_12_plen_223_part_00
MADAFDEFLFKVIVVGEVGTGKTSLVRQFISQTFSNNYKSTIGVDFALKVIRWDDRTQVRLQLWDIAGQERFGSMTRVYYKDAVGVIIVYDVTRKPTFEALRKWKNDIDNKVSLEGDRPIPCVILANKTDLLLQSEPSGHNTAAELSRFCAEYGFKGWYHTSAKTGKNVDKGLQFLVDEMLRNDSFGRESTGQSQEGRTSVVTVGSQGQQQDLQDGQPSACC